MIVAGVGCRKGTSAEAIARAIASALQEVGLAHRDIGVIAAPATKIGEQGLADAATALGIPLVLVPQGELEAVDARTQTRSERVIALIGISSAAEAAALAAAGPSSRLLAARIVIGPATCALAESGDTP